MARLASLFLALLAFESAAHIEDVCVEPGKARNFYQYTSGLGCHYAPKGLRGTFCTAAILIENSMEGQCVYNTSCRSMVHFDSVYFMATSLGFKQEVAYFLSAFSQAIDFAEFVWFDSCGRAMAESWWTPTLKGFVRTLWSAGGTNMHYGIPFVGEQDASRCEHVAEGSYGIRCPKLQHSEKNLGHWPERQSASQSTGCQVSGTTRDDYQTVAQQCPGLNYTLAKGVFYDGPLAAWKRWVFNETDILCNGGYTTLGPGDNPTTGSACPPGGIQYFGDVSKRVTSLLPLDGTLTLGEQIFDYDCEPSCACYQNCTDPRQNHEFKMINEKRVTMTPEGSSFGLYLEEACNTKGRACMPEGGPVPELVARLGVLLHYYTDRASHWYCTDAPGTGVMMQRATGKDYEYDLVLYMDAEHCAVTMHANTHYWEQAMGLEDTYLSPATMSAMYQMYDVLAEFAEKFRPLHPDWFDSKIVSMGPMKAIGTREQPGYLYNIVRHRQGEKRVAAHMAALKEAGLPPMPGWETDCHLKEANGIPVKRLAKALAEQFKAKPEDCGVRALLKLDNGPLAEHETAEYLAARAAKAFDADGTGWLSLTEVAAWEQHSAVLDLYAVCNSKTLYI